MEKKVIATTIGILAAFVALMTVLLVRIAPVTIKRATFSFQVHSELPTDPSYYIHANDTVLTSCVVDLSQVDVEVMATYPAYIEYNGQRFSFSVVIEDTIPPSIQLKDGNTTVKCYVGQTIRAADLVTVSDDSEYTVYFKLDDGSYVETMTLKEEMRRDFPIYAKDASGNEQSPVRVILDVSLDDEKPVISGVDTTSLKLNNSFDPYEGVTATDNVDGDLTSEITIEGSVDTHTLGTYRLTYRVTDSSGNQAVVTRTVVVSEDGQRGQNDVGDGPFLTNSQVEARNQKVSSLMEGELDIFSDESFVRELNHYLCTHFSPSASAQTSYDVIVNQEGNRVAMARAVKVFLDEKGLSNQIVYGSQSGMVWNIVKIGNHYRHLDVYGNYEAGDESLYLLKTTNQLDESHQYATSQYPTCE